MNHPAHSSVNFQGASTSYGITDGSYSTEGWKGDSFESPIYYGIRFNYRPHIDQPWSFTFDFNHSKIKPETLPSGLRRLEFTDGLNTFTVNVIYNHKNSIFFETFNPYIGLGIGIAYPHVEVTGTSLTNGVTYDYQQTGLAYQIMSGVTMPINNSWDMFAEYRITFTPIDASLVGGGNLKTDILNNQASLGILYKF
jgi:lipid A oxidase